MTDDDFIECPECKGIGKIYVRESGFYEEWNKCELCEGIGYFSEEDYVVMRLQGIL